MLPTIFHLPESIQGIPVLGVGLILLAWALVSGGALAWHLVRHGWTGEATWQLVSGVLVALAIVRVLPAISVAGEGLPIRGYGVMLLLAIFSAVYFARLRSAQAKLNPDLVWELAFWILPSGLLGGRMFYVIEYWEQVYSRLPAQELWFQVINFTNGGLVIYGGLIGAGAGFIAFCLWHRMPVLALADVIAPSLALGQSLGRVGCFLSGCCYGGVSHAPWAVRFPLASPAAERHLELGQLPLFGLTLKQLQEPALAEEIDTQKPAQSSPPPRTAVVVESVAPLSPAAAAGLQPGNRVLAIGGVPVETLAEARRLLALGLRTQSGNLLTAEHGTAELKAASNERSLPVHPAQLYSALDAGLLFGLLWFYYPFRRRDGELILLLLTLHPISRFLLEIIRVDEAGFWGSGLSISQHISVGLLVFAGLGWAWLLRQPAGTRFMR